jgi:RNA polymerase sigma factor (sigma-70 family)
VSPPHPEPASNADQTRWFAEEVQAHEASLRSYLRGAFPAVRDVDDVVQESYLRIWKARAVQPILSARAFLFRVAQRVALDRVRRDRASPIATVSRLDGLSVVEDKPDAAEATGRQERVRLLAEAIAGLPPRCREIFILHKIKGLARKEVATQLGLSDRTVEVQTARAMRRCAEHLRRRGVTGLFET